MSSTATRWPTPIGGWRTATRPRWQRGSQPRTNARARRSTPVLIAGRGSSASSRCWSSPVSTGRPHGGEPGLRAGARRRPEAAHPRRPPAGRRRRAGADPDRPGPAAGGRHRGHRLVPPVARRAPRRLRDLRGRRRAERAAGARRRHRQPSPGRDPRTRAASVAWLPGGEAFLYARYPEGDEYNRRIYRHQLGQPWAEDGLVWDDLPNPETWADVATSPDGRFTMVTAEVGWSRTDLHLHDASTGVWRTLIAGIDVTTRARFDGDRLVAVTTLEAARGRVVAIPLDRAVAVEQWQTLVPESAAVVQHAEPVAGGMLVVTTESAVARLSHRRRDGSSAGDVTLPDLCSVVGLDGRPDSGTAFVQIEGFTRPAGSVSLDRRRWAGPSRRVGRGSDDRRRLLGPPRALRVARRHGDRALPGASRRRRRRTPTRPASSPAMAASPSPRRRRGPRRSRPGPRPAACTPWPGCGAASRRARPGTRPGGGSTSRTSSTTSMPQPTTWCRLAAPPGSPGHPGRVERRPARGRRGDAAPRPVSSGPLRGAAPRHGPLPPVPHRPAVDRRVRRPGGGRGAGLAPGLLARTTTSSEGTCYPAVLLTHGRGRQPGGSAARPQDGGRAPVGERLPARAAHRCCTRRAVPGTARASRCTSRPTSSPTCCRSSPGSSGSRLARDHHRRARGSPPSLMLGGRPASPSTSPASGR